MKPDYEMIIFRDASEWRQWLSDHHANTDGVWIRLYKKASGIPSLSITDALDHALCYGWIDGLRKSYDELSYLQKFTPRRKNSLWSKRNIEHITRLSEAALMMPAGLTEVERAKADGRWAAAYDKPSEMVTPDDLLEELNKNPKAKAYFETLNKSSRYSMAWQLQTAKTEATRKRRLDKIISVLSAEEI